MLVPGAPRGRSRPPCPERLGEPARVRGAHRRLLVPRPRELLEAELADRLEHPEARLSVGARPRRSRLLSSSDWSLSTSALHAPSAASKVHPPSKTESARKSSRSPSSRRSYDHLTVARSVSWRGSASRPPLRRSSRRPSRSRSCAARARRRAPRRARSPTAGGRVARTAVAPLRPARRPRPPPPRGRGTARRCRRRPGPRRDRRARRRAGGARAR